MMVGEQSDWCTNTTGTECDCRSDQGSFTYGYFRDNGRIYNLMTERHPINTKTTAAAGVSCNGGWHLGNDPLQSAHSGGVTVAFADGSVHFLADSVALNVLFNLADCDDGKTIPPIY